MESAQRKIEAMRASQPVRHNTCGEDTIERVRKEGMR